MPRDQAKAVEFRGLHLIKIIFAINQAGLGPFVYRIAHPDQL